MKIRYGKFAAAAHNTTQYDIHDFYQRPCTCTGRESIWLPHRGVGTYTLLGFMCYLRRIATTAVGINLSSLYIYMGSLRTCIFPKINLKIRVCVHRYTNSGTPPSDACTICVPVLLCCRLSGKTCVAGLESESVQTRKTGSDSGRSMQYIYLYLTMLLNCSNYCSINKI